MKSEFLKLNLEDIARGSIVAIIASVLAAIMLILESGQLPTASSLKAIGITGLAAGAAYLMKNLFTNSWDQVATPEKH